MAQKPRILVQLDGDPQPSVFDSVVAVDAGVDHLLRHHGVRPEGVRQLVYGAIFTRAASELNRTAIFVGGSDVSLGEAILRAVRETFFGPMRVSVMLDANGANTTAAAAVLVAARHLDLARTTALVLGSTGPVGRRVVQLLARESAEVRAASRSRERGEAVCEAVLAKMPTAKVTAHVCGDAEQTRAAADGVDLVVAAGALGVEIMAEHVWQDRRDLKVAVDLNAVPPPGLGGVEPADSATERHGIHCYGAIGVGGVKMKVHKAAIRRLFESNDQVLDAEEILELGRSL